ncbi:hypothetical protein E2R51_11620 [Jeotgalibacillus sp. S-D1]|uniref:hypothetical protein n=1 Tax=Jeotgalibacillus sp. S-D1 TaxID=2552189 RepID=UPI00105A3410|nr:hypothetical protein [Jeotgalibacillus sp. S-D1]TDL31862.1 hypothetical protein E2R51_11620 [Jeotgalibacillus sp. S-D1]
MKKKVFVLFLLVMVLIALSGYAIFRVGTDVASERVVDSVTEEMEENGQMDEVKAYIESDPALQQFVEDAKNADEEALPFTTKEEATRVLIRKVGVSELQSLGSKARAGNISEEEIMASLEENLTEEEITALKVIAYKEIYNQ